jgi:release factor glutamine methyltransferase
MALALSTDRGGVMARKPDAIAKGAADRLEDLLAARCRRTPLQYLTRTVEFFGLELETAPGVLIPRPETEGLVEAVLELDLPADARVADLGTGSGCIAIALASLRPGWRVTAIDASEAALANAGRNAARHHVAERVELVRRDFTFVPDAERRTYHAVVSNPPYVAEAEWEGLEPEVRDHEPRVALVPGPNGNEAYEAIAAAAPLLLAPRGRIALELGWKSEDAVRRLVAQAGFAALAVHPDLAGIPRVLTAQAVS